MAWHQHLQKTLMDWQKMIIMDDRLEYLDAFFNVTDWSFLLFFSYSLFYKSIVQLKSFDNIFSDLDDASNVLLFRSFDSYTSSIDHPVLNLNDEQWQKHILVWLYCHCYIIDFSTNDKYVWEEAQVPLIDNYICLFFTVKREIWYVLSIIDNPQMVFDTFYQQWTKRLLWLIEIYVEHVRKR
jgi:hypothetical protein